MIINYPDAFPCPTWSYGTSTLPYPLRTQFDNGWTRQRRGFPQTGMSANLSFVMGTVMFEKWQTWVGGLHSQSGLHHTDLMTYTF